MIDINKQVPLYLRLDIENRHKGEKIIVDNFFTPIVNNVR
ncbi:hypothetical protein IFVP408_C1210120 [Vibrio parahaemolyticus]